jgi:hypothetical protein
VGIGLAEGQETVNPAGNPVHEVAPELHCISGNLAEELPDLSHELMELLIAAREPMLAAQVGSMRAQQYRWPDRHL